MVDSDEHPRADFERREIEVDDTPESTARGRGSSVTWIVLAAGLALTVLLARFGIWFFFLPVIIPFGLGGRSLTARLGAAWRRRFVRIERGTLSVLVRSPAGEVRQGSIDVSGGAAVSVLQAGLRPDGRFDAVLRVVAAGGAFELELADVAHARKVRQRLIDLFGESSVSLVDPETPLQGGVSVRSVPGGEELAWGGRRARPWGRRRHTVLRVDGQGWMLQVHSGSRLEASTGGPGVPEGRIATNERVVFLESSFVAPERCLELLSDGEIVARVGSELSEPELRFVVARLVGAQPSRRLAR